MVYAAYSADTSIPGISNYQVPIVTVPTAPIKPEEPKKPEVLEKQIKPEEPKEPNPKIEALKYRNKVLGTRIQNYLNGDEGYKKSHASYYSRAKRSLAKENKWLVVEIARELVGKGLTLGDIVGEGTLGLMRACEDCNPELNFLKYAEKGIKRSIKRGFHKELRSHLQIPYHICQSRKRIFKIESVLEKELNRKPESVEIAERFNQTYYPNGPLNSHIRGYHIDALKIAIKKPRSFMTKNKYGDRFEKSIYDRYPTPDETASLKEELERARRFYEELDEKERTVLALSYGLDDNDPMNFREIGDMFGCTRANINKIHKKALRKLREKMCPEEIEEKKDDNEKAA